jgi:hypothetical protein
MNPNAPELRALQLERLLRIHANSTEPMILLTQGPTPLLLPATPEVLSALTRC